ncbi:MAG: hypothetical protein EZS28_049659, partial [Streblomastix strix]
AQVAEEGCDNYTTLCRELPKQQLLVIDDVTCPCYDYGDPRYDDLCDLTSSCTRASTTQLLEIPRSVCQCLEVGDKREECESTTIPCDKASRMLLEDDPQLKICDCVVLGDPRDGCQSDTKPCNKLTISEIEDLPTSLCVCSKFGDPRDKCSSKTSPCNVASANDLKSISVGICQCIDGDLRDECTSFMDQSLRNEEVACFHDCALEPRYPGCTTVCLDQCVDENGKKVLCASGSLRVMWIYTLSILAIPALVGMLMT